MACVAVQVTAVHSLSRGSKEPLSKEAGPDLSLNHVAPAGESSGSHSTQLQGRVPQRELEGVGDDAPPERVFGAAAHHAQLRRMHPMSFQQLHTCARRTIGQLLVLASVSLSDLREIHLVHC